LVSRPKRTPPAGGPRVDPEGDRGFWGRGKQGGKIRWGRWFGTERGAAEAARACLGGWRRAAATLLGSANTVRSACSDRPALLPPEQRGLPCIPRLPGRREGAAEGRCVDPSRRPPCLFPAAQSNGFNARHHLRSADSKWPLAPKLDTVLGGLSLHHSTQRCFPTIRASAEH